MVGGYDLVLVDTPPGERLLVQAALSVGAFVLIPTRADDASLDGLERVAERFLAARQRNPELALLGVCLFGAGARSRRLAMTTREVVSQALDGAAPVFQTQIRHLESRGSGRPAQGGAGARAGGGDGGRAARSAGGAAGPPAAEGGVADA